MPEALLKEIVPQEYASEKYLADLLEKPSKEALPEVFKKLHHAQGLIGKKTGLPGADATDADWDTFLKQLRPNSAEEYQFGEKEKIDPAFLKVVQQSFFEGGVNPRQAKAFMEKYRAGMGEYVKGLEAKKATDKAAADKAFEELAKTGGQDADKMAFARKQIAEHAPAPFKPFVDKLDSNSLVILAAVINGIAEKFMPEDQLRANGKGGGGGNNGGANKRAEAMAQMKKVQAMDQFAPEYKAECDKLARLYQEADAEAKGK